MRQRNYKDAAKAFRAVVDQNNQDAEGWFHLGLALVQIEKEIKNASKAFETALKLRPDHAQAHTGLSYSFYQRDKLPEAVREAQAALKVDPRIREAHYIIGMSQLRTGSDDEALKTAETLIQLEPQWSLGNMIKSQALVRFLGDYIVEKEESPEERAARKIRYRDSAAALEKYLQLEPDAPEKQSWTAQLESLRF